MKCDAECQSGEDASIFFSYIEDGTVKKVNLCKHCARERGVDDPSGYSLIDMLHGMGEETSSGSKPAQADELTCDFCGFTQSDFKKTGRFGCAKCYQVFSEGLESLLEAMHKNTEHAGKVPSFFEEEDSDEVLPQVPFPPPLPEIDFSLETEEEPDDEIDETETSVEVSVSMLKDQLDLAVSAEDYEEAARLRDEISKLEDQL